MGELLNGPGELPQCLWLANLFYRAYSAGGQLLVVALLDDLLGLERTDGQWLRVIMDLASEAEPQLAATKLAAIPVARRYLSLQLALLTKLTAAMNITGSGQLRDFVVSIAEQPAAAAPEPESLPSPVRSILVTTPAQTLPKQQLILAVRPELAPQAELNATRRVAATFQYGFGLPLVVELLSTHSRLSPVKIK